MSKGKPIKTVNYPFLVFFPNHLFLLEVVEVVITWEWEEYGKKFELGRAPIFEKHVLTPWASKNPKTLPILPCIHVFHFGTTILSLDVSSLRPPKFPVCIHSRFCSLLHFSLGREIVFGNAKWIGEGTMISRYPMSRFFQCEAIEQFWKSNFYKGGCFTDCHLHFSLKMFFLKPRSCILLCVHPWFCSKPVWSGIRKKLA